MIRNTIRVARSSHRCGCGNVIPPGQRYVDAVASPNHDDLGNPHWWRLAECESCARRYGRMGADS